MMVAKPQRDFVEEACTIIHALTMHLEESPECIPKVRDLVAKVKAK